MPEGRGFRAAERLVITLGGITASLLDKSLIIGAVILALTVLGALFHFLRLSLFSAGLDKRQAGVLSGAIMVVAGMIVYRQFFN